MSLEFAGPAGTPGDVRPSAGSPAPLKRLERLAGGLRFTGMVVVASTICTLLLIGFWALALQKYPRAANPGVLLENGPALILLSTAVALFAILLHAFFIKEGDVIFDEISEELHWQTRARAGANLTSKEKVPETRPALDVRIALRNYLNNSSLLIISGRLGMAAYAGLNIMVGMAVIFLSRL